MIALHSKLFHNDVKYSTYYVVVECLQVRSAPSEYSAVYDYDFGNEGKGDQGILNWTLYKGHIRKRQLCFNQKYKRVCKTWAEKHRRKL